MSIELKAGATGPVLICHGAEHVLNIAAAEDNPWIDQGISLNPEPGDSLSIVAEPALGEYQKFLADGGQWKLKCPADGTDVDFNLQLQSEFTAQPYKVPFRLGDFRREILDERPPISAPVVGDKVVAAVQVGSFYTKKELENVEVEWMYDWKPVDRVPTGHSGWSSFEHEVLTEGEHQIMASVHSPYDDRPSKFFFLINAYVDSPWEQASLFINGERVAWNSPSVVLFRGQPNEVRIEAPFLQEKEISLGLMNPDGLSIEAAPAFEAWVPVPDGTTTWVVTPAGNISGRITLKLSSKETAQAWEVPCAVLSLNLADEADVLVDGVEVPPTGNWFLRDKPQTVTLTLKSGSPLTGLPVSLNCVIKSGLDIANVVSTPAFGSEQTTYSWVVTGKTKSGTFQLALTGKGMTTPITLVISKLVSSNLADEAEVKIGGVAVPPGGNWFIRDQAQTVTLTPHLNSPLEGLPVTLTCVIKSGLDIANVMSAPVFGSEQTTYSWAVTGRTKSGTFQLVLMGKGMTTPISLEISKLVSSNLADEAEVKIGGVAVPAGGNWFIRDQAQTVTLTAHLNSPLAGLPVTLTCAIKSGLDIANVVSAPAFGSEQTTYSWAVTGRTKSGAFQLALAGKGMTTPIALTISKLVSSNLVDEADVTIGDLPVPEEGNWFLRTVSKTVILVPKSSSPLAGMPVVLSCRVISGLDITDVVSVPPFDTEQTNSRWTVTGRTNSGTFQLAFRFEGADIAPFSLVVSKLISTDLSHEAEMLIDGEPVSRTKLFIRDRKRTVTLKPKGNSPIGAAKIALRVSSDRSFFLKSVPDFDVEQSVHRWEVTGALESFDFNLRLSPDQYVKELSAHCAVMSEKLSDEAYIWVGGKQWQAGEVWFYADPRSVILAPRIDSPLRFFLLSAECVEEDGGNSVTSDPPFFTEQDVHKWMIQARVKGARFNLLFHLDGVPTPITVGPCVRY